jgi:hypothetical protein
MKKQFLLVSSAVALFSSAAVMADSNPVTYNANMYQQFASNMTFATAQSNCAGRTKANYGPGHLAKINTTVLLNYITGLMKNNTANWSNSNSWADGALATVSIVKWSDTSTNTISSTGVIQVSGGATITGYNANMSNPTNYALSINTSSQLVLSPKATALAYHICEWNPIM